MTTTTSTTDTYTAPVDVQTIIIPCKVWEDEPLEAQAMHGGETGMSKQVYVEEGKRKIPREMKGISAEERRTRQRSRELKRKTAAAKDSLLKNCQPLVDQGDSALFEEDLFYVEPQPELPGPYDPERVRILYSRACEMLKVVPSSRFKHGLRSGRVIAGHQGMGPLGAKAVAMSLLTNLTVTELHIPDNKLGPKGMCSVASLIRSNDLIKVLDISDNGLGRKGAKILAAAIKENNSIQQINAAGNMFDDNTGLFFEEAFKFNSMIKQLDFSRNRFCELGAFKFARGLEENDTVTHLDLSYNCIRRLGIKGVAKMLAHNSTLKQLDLSWNGIDIDGAMQLGQGLNQNTSLSVLNLTGCRLTGVSLLELLGKMKANKALKTLQIPHNPLTNADLTLFLRALDRLPDLALSSIDASTVAVSQDFRDLKKKLAQTRPGFMISCSVLLSIHDYSKSMLENQDLSGGDPLKLILRYTRQKKMRIVDIFTQLDTDKSGTLSRQELIIGLANVGIPLSIAKLDMLVARLDENGDGQIDYKELVEGIKQFTRRLHKKGSLTSDDVLD